LPTEAQWEYAATGRGWQNPYVWGDDSPTCARAVYGRNKGPPVLGSPSECFVDGMPDHPFSVGSADVSRDGAYDLAGNVTEWTLDQDAPTDGSGPCWTSTRYVDPVCAPPPPVGATAE